MTRKKNKKFLLSISELFHHIFMRLWHKDLIDVLPRQQLIAQWRECVCIAKNIKTNGTPNHILVNKILNFPQSHFASYCHLIKNEILQRGYNCNWERIVPYIEETEAVTYENLFENWMNYRYFVQCFHNLEEKFDCGGISYEEFKQIKNKHAIIETCQAKRNH